MSKANRGPGAGDRIELSVVPEPGPDAQDEADADQMLEVLTMLGAELRDTDDPLQAEILGSMLVSTGESAGEDFTDAMVDGVIPAMEEAENTAALSLLRALETVTERPVKDAAASVAARMVAAGVAEPSWAPRLRQQVVPGDCWELADPSGCASALACSFRRGERSHGIMVSVDELNCGAADDAHLIDGDDLLDVLRTMVTESRAAGNALELRPLEPAEFRWRMECAMDARAVHDAEDAEDPEVDPPQILADDEDALDDDEDTEPEYPVLVPLLRARMRTLPEPTKPKPPHGEDSTVETAPVYRVKVSLRGAKPPIWRRLEVSGDTSLGELHTVIQGAFEWDNAHLHEFQTSFGDFGMHDEEGDDASEESVTLEQVAAAERDKVRYVYDFGDHWEHEILVEKILDRQPGVAYPRCTGGRRAAPPEDCGGLGGYQDLIDVLADPRRPEHEDRLQWLGLNTPEEFDPSGFDRHEITRNLPSRR